MFTLRGASVEQSLGYSGRAVHRAADRGVPVSERRCGCALLGAKFDASLADIGLLIGLYFTPGVALSLPGGAVGKRIGDKTTISGALVLMLIGQLAMVRYCYGDTTGLLRRDRSSRSARTSCNRR
ncbi:hypothetical protein [Bradyrhizobium paxllaeri]|uniref:hypothetical protein n=1 Tax=Bradyrhizobium paxllaeri TaxID=190148 RepID=UPI001FE608F7|nr:hypothetical protein [Bradyrhizobium paxllaeri]